MGNKIFIISGPSGVGKTTLFNEIIKNNKLKICRAITHTTRKMRPNEVNNVDYHFVDTKEFKRMINDNCFVEWTIYSMNHYGTSIQAIEDGLKKNNVVCIIDTDGKEQIINSLGKKYKIYTIFLYSPSEDILRKRLIDRGVNEPKDLERRIAIGKLEMEKMYEYNLRVEMSDMKQETETVSKYIMKLTNEK